MRVRGVGIRARLPGAVVLLPAVSAAAARSWRGPMRRCCVRVVLLGAAAAVGGAASLAAEAGVASAAIRVTQAGAWGTAIEVPGLGALNTGGFAHVISVSCVSAGNCAAGGYYQDASQQEAFVVTEKNGVWGTAIEVPGLGALNTGGSAQVSSVSCASAGNCAADGYYQGAGQQAFVVTEKNGVWGTAIEVPGLGALNTGGNAGVSSVSCASAGNCAAGGSYFDSFDLSQAFVVTEKNGVWGTAIEVPGLRALNTGGLAQVSSVSCGSAGNCAAGGSYEDGFLGSQAFAVTEKHGVWGTAIQVPGLRALNTGGYAGISSVSCASAGNCAAGGYYKDDAGQQAFVVSERQGAWRKAIQVPGLGRLNTDGMAFLNQVSCSSAGNCAAGGYYNDDAGQQAFVVGERQGAWGTARQLPGLGRLNKGKNAVVTSVSCRSAGSCAAGGDYVDGSRFNQGFVVSERHGRWGTAIQVPGLGKLNAGGLYGGAAVTSVSCGSAGNCAAGGFYRDGSLNVQGFVATST